MFTKLILLPFPLEKVINSTLMSVFNKLCGIDRISYFLSSANTISKVIIVVYVKFSQCIFSHQEGLKLHLV